jgi:hypothetical protein
VKYYFLTILSLGAVGKKRRGWGSGRLYSAVENTHVFGSEDSQAEERHKH